MAKEFHQAKIWSTIKLPIDPVRQPNPGSTVANGRLFPADIQVSALRPDSLGARLPEQSFIGGRSQGERAQATVSHINNRRVRQVVSLTNAQSLT